MKARKTKTYAGVALAMFLLPALTFFLTERAEAAERQFLVMLALSPKEYPGSDGVPPNLPIPESIRKAYFDISDPNVSSFAEYWEEISYGDVIVTGDVTGWVSLPWAVSSQNFPVGDDIPYIDLNQGGTYTYGHGERFNNFLAATAVDLDGEIPGPFGPSFGSGDSTTLGNPVWRPGERFVDMDGDGAWDGLDEANNRMDHDGDGRPDLQGPWVDINLNGVPDFNGDNCVYLADSDNDGNPNCCPGGPGTCARRGVEVEELDDPRLCPGTTFGGFDDCNGNLIPDICDIRPTDNPDAAADCAALGWMGPVPDVTSRDRLPIDPNSGDPTPDGIPDECQFANWREPCVDGVNCEEIALADNLPARCEWDDFDDDGQLDQVEPWENFLRRWDPCNQDPDADPRVANENLAHWVKVYDPESPNASTPLACSDPPTTPYFYGDPQYIEDNYPARDADKADLIAQTTGSPVFGSVDPTGIGGPDQVCRLEPIPPGIVCECAARTFCEPIPDDVEDPPGICEDQDEFPLCIRPGLIGDSCRALVYGEDFPLCTGNIEEDPAHCSIDRYCLISFHNTFNPPDSWTNQTDGATVSSKIQIEEDEVPFSNTVGLDNNLRTPPPTWLAEFWEDRYHTTPPAWTGSGGIPLVRDFDPGERRYFKANRGGLNGDGTGWIGCGGALGPDIIFETGFGQVPIAFDNVCNAPILPDQRANGLQGPGQYYDGWVEFDDLASSRYHRSGDERFGEVTSPFNDEIYGNDLGPHRAGSLPNPDGEIPPAGPYALNIHGNGGFDAGNQMIIELLTWRNQAPFTSGSGWEQEGYNRFHPYAGSTTGVGLGFRDFNLDGLIDTGEQRLPGTENYLADLSAAPNDGVASQYPWNRTRVIEDVVEAVDSLLDFDDFIDESTKSLVGVGTTTLRNLDGSACTVSPDGVVSGIVLFPDGTECFNGVAPSFVPIHNQDSDNPNTVLPCGSSLAEPHLNANIFFHNLAYGLDCDAEADGGEVGAFQTAFSAHEWLHAWEGLPDLYDYDNKSDDPAVLALEQNPVGQWDIMAKGGLVHPCPILKQSSSWLEPIDLRSVLTPGVSRTLTLPPYEVVRDRNAYYLTNPRFRAEQYFFWNVGQGFDEPRPGAGMPGTGLLIMHTDTSTNGNPNSEGLPSGQRNSSHPEYLIVQADGRGELEAVQSEGNTGDASDPWPGTEGKTQFNFDTVPASTWWAQQTWNGVDIEDITPDGDGSMTLQLSWLPTNLPSLRFTDPPGGVSVDDRYPVRFTAVDVFGGTRIEIYYTADPDNLTVSPANRVGTMQKINPGTRRLSMNWDITNVPDGRYYLFAKLIPGQGSDGTEVDHIDAIPGRQNSGVGSLTVHDVDIARNRARLETWTVRLVDILPDGTQDWRVNGTLSQPEPSDQDADQDPWPHLLVDPVTGKGDYVSVGEEVEFTLEYDFVPGVEPTLGDTWTFVTTGLTAPSAPVQILDGEINEDPRAVIIAAPLTVDPGEAVFFNALNSSDPNGEALRYEWNFGDGSPVATAPTLTHTFNTAGRFSVSLRAINVNSGRFGEAFVDIEVVNNSPSAFFTAQPLSGAAPLTVEFDAGDSFDIETPRGDLIFQWSFGDGSTANDAGNAGTLIQTEHIYVARADGSLCTPSSPCEFLAKLTVTDLGGEPGAKTSVYTRTIRVGNTDPVPVISNTSLQGGDPLTVTFNASGSFDADGQEVRVTWTWGDGSNPESYTAAAGADGNGNVSHTFTRRAGEDSSQFTVTADVTDGFATIRYSATVTVSEAFVGSSQPQAAFTIDPDPPVLGEPFTANGSLSFDRPSRGLPDKFEWDWGDGTETDSGVTATHTYEESGLYTIRLTVSDDENPPNFDSATKVVRVTDEGGGSGDGENGPPTARITVTPETAEGLAGVTEFVFSAENSTDPDNDELSYSWFFGDDSPRDNRAVAAHVFTQPGLYRVLLSVTDEANVSDDATIEIRVRSNTGNRAPVPLIATGPRRGTAPLSLTFDGQLSYDPDGDPLEYRWEFVRDNTLYSSANGSVVTQLFDEDGVYEVVLEVTDGRGGQSRTEPEIVTVTARVDDNTNGRPANDNENDNGNGGGGSTGFCGFGMLMSFFGSLLGLSLMGFRRRR